MAVRPCPVKRDTRVEFRGLASSCGRSARVSYIRRTKSSRYRHSSVVLDHTDNNQEQTVVVLGGFQQGQGVLDSVLVLNLAESNKQWREGPPMHQKRSGHAAVVCNGAIYVMGGDNGAPLDCMEQKLMPIIFCNHL